MTRFIVQYLTEATGNGESESEIETVFVESSSEDSAKQLVVNRCGAFINILSVAVTKGEGGPGLIESTAISLASVQTTPSKQKVPKPEKVAVAKEPEVAKEPKMPKVKPEQVPGEKKVTASSRVRERIILAKTDGLSLEQACDGIVLWCIDNLGMSKSSARGYTTSQWIRVP